MAVINIYLVCYIILSFLSNTQNIKWFPICYVVISENLCRWHDNILGNYLVFLMWCYQLCLDRLFVAFLCCKRGSCRAPSGEQTMLYQYARHGWWVFLPSLLYAVVIYQSYVINTSSISSNLLPTGQTIHVFPKRPLVARGLLTSL